MKTGLLKRRAELTRFKLALGLFYFLSGIMALMLVLGGSANQSARAASVPTSWQKGVTMQPRWPEDFGSPNTDASIDQARQANANYVTLLIPYQQDNIYSTYIYKAPNAPTDAALIHAVQKAHSVGMKVTFKLHLDPQDGHWRADINPGDRNSWYTNYGNILNYYATLAQQNGVEQMIVGAELVSMATYTSNSDNTQRWRTMIAQVRQRFGGTLTYSANWGGSFYSEEFPHIGFWDALDYIGISAYFGLVNYNNPSVSALMDGWSYWNNSKIQPFQQSIGKPVLFTEIGYRSVDGTAINPWDSNHWGNYNTQEQVNAVEALMQYWSGFSWFAGIQYWAWNTDANCCPGQTNYEVQNKPAYDTMKTGFASGGGGGGGGNVTSFSLVSASVTPGSAAPGSTFTLNGRVISNTPSPVVNIDFEVYNQAGNKIYQQVSSNQTFAGGEARTYTFTWNSPTTQAQGQYSLVVAVFNSDWTVCYLWAANAATFNLTAGTPSATPTPTALPTATPVGAPTATPTPSNSPYTIEIWWPSNGVTLVSTQYLKAKVSELQLNQYNMYWQVDGQALNLMSDQQNEGAHKEALVNTSAWNWRGNGPYTVNFIAKDLSGRILQQKSVQVYVQH